MPPEKDYIQAAKRELLNPTFEVTKQYLAVMSLVLENGEPKVHRINHDFSDELIAIYFGIEKERFSIVVNVSKTSCEVQWVWVESGHRVYLTATSDTLGFSELSSYLNIKPVEGWSTGDLMPNGAKSFDFSRVSYEPITSEAYGLEEKVELLLAKLENDITGIQKLVSSSNALIQVHRSQYVSGNAGIHLSTSIIERLNRLKLEVDIDIEIVGQRIT